MKRYLFAVLLALWPFLASAQDIYKPNYKANAPSIASDQVAFAASSLTATSATLSAFADAVRLVCSAACFVALSATNAGASPDLAATVNEASGNLLPANVPETFLINGGEYVIVIGNAASGTLYVRTLVK